MSAQDIQELLDRISSLLASETRGLLMASGLQPVQFDALYYLSNCNRYSDTPKSVAEFLGLTKGTVSQSLKALEGKGLIIKSTDLNDKRRTHIEVTAKGLKLIDKFSPSKILQQYSQQTTTKTQHALIGELTSLLSGIQQSQGNRTFGKCFTCVHNIRLTKTDFLCGLTKEPLAAKETQLICAEHE